MFAPALFSPAALRKRHALCTAELWPGSRPPSVDEDERAFPVVTPEPSALSDDLFNALGFPRFGALAVRADEIEVVARLVDDGASVQAVATRIGCAVDEVGELVGGLRAFASPQRSGPRSRARSGQQPARARRRP